MTDATSLDEAQRAKVRMLYEQGRLTQLALARRFGCSARQIGEIVREKRRTHAEITLAPLSPDDVPALKPLFLDVREQTFSWLPPGTFDIEDFERDIEGEEVTVARMDDNIAGFVSIWPQGNFLHHLYVATAFQGLGIGSLLHDHAVTSLDHPATLKCFDRNTRAFDYYLRKGWVAGERVEGKQGPYTVLTFHPEQSP